MSLTLTYSGTTVDLDPDLLWSDEFGFSRVGQTAAPSVSGALIVQNAQRTTAGRPITLQPEDDRSAWMPRATVEQIGAWRDIAGAVLTLAGLRGVTRQVMFRHQDGALDARPVVHYNDVVSTDDYHVTIRLMEV